MALELGTIGVWLRVGDVTPQMAAEVEQLGYGALWVGGSPRGDLEDVERLIAATDRITVVTGIVNMWRDGAGEVAASYGRIESRYPGRFVLGVGVGHREATVEYARPLDRMDEYLGRLEASGVPPQRTVLAALGPRALQMAAARTAGAHPYLTTPHHTRYARDIIGSGPRLAPEHKVIVGADPQAARALGRSQVARYLALENYRNNLLREGWAPTDLTDGGSDRLIDALALHGTPARVAAGIRAHLDAGADHVGVQVLAEDPTVGYRELAPFLMA